jgi:hypothetical protein
LWRGAISIPRITRLAIAVAIAVPVAVPACLGSQHDHAVLDGRPIGGRGSSGRDEQALGIARRRQRGASERRPAHAQGGRTGGSVATTSRNIDLDVEQSAVDLHLPADRRGPHDLAIDGTATAEIEPRVTASNQLEHSSDAASSGTDAAGLMRRVRKTQRRRRSGGLGQERQDCARAKQRTATARRT